MRQVLIDAVFRINLNNLTLVLISRSQISPVIQLLYCLCYHKLVNLQNKVRLFFLAETYSESCQRSKMDLFVKIVKYFYNFFAKNSILDILQGSQYATA